MHLLCNVGGGHVHDHPALGPCVWGAHPLGQQIIYLLGDKALGQVNVYEPWTRNLRLWKGINIILLNAYGEPTERIYM